VPSSRYRLLIPTLLVTSLLLNAIMAWKDRDLVRKGYPDFTIFYTAGTMVRTGMAASLYDERAEFQVQRQFAPEVSIRHGALPYNHPPFEALVFVPLALLPYLPAYLAWNAVSIGMLGLALIILRPYVPVLQTRRVWVWLLCALGFLPIFVCVLQGQDMLLLFFLVAATYASLKRERNWLAGCFLGMGVFRPHLVLPLALVLLFSRRWKAALGCGCSALAMAAISIAVAGRHVVFGYPSYVWNLEKVMGRGSIVPDNMPNLRGLVAIFFRDGHHAAVALTAAASASLLVLAIWTFRRAEHAANLELGFSVAVLVAILIGYHTFIYDLGLLLVPILLSAQDHVTPQRWKLALPVVTMFCTPLLMLIWLRFSHLNFVAPLLLLWLWGMVGEIPRLQTRPTQGSLKVHSPVSHT